MNENNNSNNTEPILPQGDASNTPIMTPETSIPTPVIDTKNTPSAALNVSQTITETTSFDVKYPPKEIKSSVYKKLVSSVL